jgi:hypothetical protein
VRGREAVLGRSLIVGGFGVLFFLLPHALAGDDNQRFSDIEQLLHHGRLSDSKYSLVMPLLSVPVLALGNVVESPTWWAARFNVIVVAAGVAVSCWLLRGRADPRLLRLIVLVLLFASFLADRLRDYNAEVLTPAILRPAGRAVAGLGGTPDQRDERHRPDPPGSPAGGRHVPGARCG